MTDHRMVGSVRTCPFLGKFPLAQSIGPVLCFAQWVRRSRPRWWFIVFVPQRRGASAPSQRRLVSSQRRLPLSVYIYTSECHLQALTEPLFWDVPKHWEVSNLIRNKAVAKKSKRHFTSLAF